MKNENHRKDKNHTPATPRRLHGNSAKATPPRPAQGLYRDAAANGRVPLDPQARDDKVMAAKEFVDENQK